MLTLVPGATLAKSRVLLETMELFHRFTRVAVARDVESYVTTPMKSMLPTIGPCPLVRAHSPKVAKATVRMATAVLKFLFIVISRS